MDGVDAVGLLEVALALPDPWRVASASFDPDAGQLDINVDFERGATFPCPELGCQATVCKVHDTVSRTWRHMDFFQHKAYLHARLPRVKCAEHGVKTVEVPWAREGSGFTLLFEALVCSLAPHMAVLRIAELVRERDTRLWRILDYYVTKARAAEDYSNVSSVGIDETSSKRGHNYVSVFMDLDVRRVLFACDGRNAATVGAFALDLKAHGGDPDRVTGVCCDMGPAFIAGVAASLKNAEITFDRYHVIAQLNKAVDQVRRAESKSRPELKGTRYLWLKNHDNLTEKQVQELAWLLRPSLQLATMRAWRWRIDFDAFFAQAPDDAEAYLARWCEGAKRSRLEPIKAFVDLVYKHWDGILAWHQNPVSNGLLEGTNSLIQAAKRKARGYRNTNNLITMIYLIAGRLPLPTPRTT